MKKFFLAKSDKNALKSSMEAFNNPALKNSAMNVIGDSSAILGGGGDWLKVVVTWSKKMQ